MSFKFLSKVNNSQKSMGDKIINWCLSLIIFFLPLFFFPLSVSTLELNKMFLFYLLVFIAFLTWIINSVLRKELVIKHSFLNTLIIIFGLIYLLASIFSDDRFLSFIGAPLSHGSFLALLFFIIFYFLVTNTIRGIEEGWQLLRLFLYSGILIVIFNLAQLFGVHILPFDFTQNSAFNLVANSVSILAIYLVVLFVIGLGFLIRSTKQTERISSEVFLVLVFALLFFLDQDIGWYLLIFGLFAWLVFLCMQSKRIKAFWVILPTVLLIISLAFLFFSTTSLTWLNPPTDLKLDYHTTLTITKSSLTHSLILGSGPETFHYDFSAYRPVDYNNSILWQLRFDRSTNEFFQLIITAGFFAFLAFIIISLWYLIRVGKNILVSSAIKDEWYYQSVIFSGFLVIFLSGFLYPFSTATSFIFWFLLALGGLFLNRKEVKLNLQKSAGINFIFSLGFSLLLIGAVSFIYFGMRIWLGDYYLAQAQTTFEETNNPLLAIEKLEKGVSLSPWLAAPHLALADGLMVSANYSVQQNDAASTGNLLNRAEQEIELAIKKEPKNVVVYEHAGEIYQLISKAGGSIANEKIIAVYEKAIERESNSPSLYLTLGSVYFSQAQIIQARIDNSQEPTGEESDLETATQNALEKIKRATELKSDYENAEQLYAQVLEFQGKFSEAVEYLNTALANNAASLTLLEERGKALLAEEKLEEAQNDFLTILALAPNHANAHYWLALIYEKQGEKDKAIAELEQVLKTNPGNSLVTQKISQLKGESN